MDSKIFNSYFRPIGPEYRLETNGCGYTMNDPNTNANVNPVLYKLTKENHPGMRHWKDIKPKDQSEIQDSAFNQSRNYVHKERKPIQKEPKDVHAAARDKLALASTATQTNPISSRSIECQVDNMMQSPEIDHVRSNLMSPRFVPVPDGTGLSQKKPTLVSAGTMTDDQTIQIMQAEYQKNDDTNKVLQVSRATLTSPHVAPSPPLHREYPQMIQTPPPPRRQVPYEVITVQSQRSDSEDPTRIQYLNYKREAFDWERQQPIKKYPVDEHPLRKTYPNVRKAGDPLRDTYPRMYKAADGTDRHYMVWLVFTAGTRVPIGANCKLHRPRSVVVSCVGRSGCMQFDSGNQ